MKKISYQSNHFLSMLLRLCEIIRDFHQHYLHCSHLHFPHVFETTTKCDKASLICFKMCTSICSCLIVFLSQFVRWITKLIQGFNLNKMTTFNLKPTYICNHILFKMPLPEYSISAMFEDSKGSKGSKPCLRKVKVLKVLKHLKKKLRTLLWKVNVS